MHIVHILVKDATEYELGKYDKNYFNGSRSATGGLRLQRDHDYKSYVGFLPFLLYFVLQRNWFWLENQSNLCLNFKIQQCSATVLDC